MRARPEIRERLLAAKMKRWALIGRSPVCVPKLLSHEGAAELFEAAG